MEIDNDGEKQQEDILIDENVMFGDVVTNCFSPKRVDSLWLSLKQMPDVEVKKND